MRNFDVKEYISDFEKAYGRRADIEKMADTISERGYDNIVVIGIGGTWAEWHPVVHVAKHYTDVPIILENAAEFCVKTNKRYLTKNSIVLTASDSGNTKEVVAAIKLCKEMGVESACLTRNGESELGKLCDYVVADCGGDCENAYMMYFMLVLRLLYNRGEFPSYPKFADQMATLADNLIRIREEFEPRAAEIARNYAKEPYNIFTGSGALWGETYLFSMCILEEMQWVRTKSVTSADFFHGTLELVEKDVPVFCFKGEDEYRPLDERVERFCEKLTDKLTVIDTKDYVLQGIDDEFRVICSPMILTALVTERLAAHYELNTGHSLKFRRYYRQFDY
ncbi:MAG: SIS domain-containing protein [Firmicutes bacterium]|nr:SIS domain-containing protein [Bacillota bacterium]